MNFLRLTIMFYNAVNIIYDVGISPTSAPCPHTAKFKFADLRNNIDQ